MYALTNCIIYTGQQELTDHALLIDGFRIVDLIPLSQVNQELAIFDLAGHNVAPGFIDLQLNGCGGVMFNDAIASRTLDIMHQTNLRSGTTSFLPTLITTSDEDIRSSLNVVKEYQTHNSYSVLGLHLEGPYLNPKRKGIHDERYIRPPDQTILKQIAETGRDVVKLVTLAPEIAEADHIKLLADQGIVVSAGHSNATFEQGLAGFDAGIQMVTHLFNAMSPWLGRSPGMVGAAFSRNEVYAGIIADGEHVHFSSIELAKRIKQDKLVLVTDATPPVGTQMESFWIGGQEVFYRDGKCVSADGTLGGSALTLIQAIANCVHHANIPLPEALRMASTYPAQIISVDHELGAIAPSYVANLIIFTNTFQVTGIVDRGHYTQLA
ncbi:MAG TPA: N-acetylglucosamine-6-phosphate deacetylase [Crinalium sp.]|jgi:N-acetylglucosamine-6-phosphate deacetylase